MEELRKHTYRSYTIVDWIHIKEVDGLRHLVRHVSLGCHRDTNDLVACLGITVPRVCIVHIERAWCIYSMCIVYIEFVQWCVSCILLLTRSHDKRRTTTHPYLPGRFQYRWRQWVSKRQKRSYPVALNALSRVAPIPLRSLCTIRPSYCTLAMPIVYLCPGHR